MDETIVNPDIKKTFPWKLVMIFLLFSGVIIIMGRYYYRYERNRIFTEQKKSLSAIATLKIKQISQWYSDKLADAVVIKDNKPLVSRIKQFFKDENQTGIRKEISIWLEALNTQYDYNSVALLDTLLRVKIATSNADPLADDSIRKELNNVIRYHKIIVTDLYKTGTSKAIRMDLLVPLLDSLSKEQKTIGLIILSIDPDKILFPLVQSWPTPSKSSETLILRKEGDSVLYLNELRHRKNTAFNLKFPLSNENLLATKAANGFEGVTEGTDYRNVPVIGALSKIPGLPWYMVAKTDKEEILAPFKRYSFITVFVIILLILINASIFGFWIWQQRIRFYRSQLKNEVSLRESEMRFRQTFDLSPIGIVMVGLDRKFLRCNDSFLKSLGFKMKELAGKTIADVTHPEDISIGMEEMIAIAKGELETSHVQKRYLRKDGEIVWGDVLISLIRNNSGEPQYFLAIIQDITESKKIVDALRESEERFRSLYENVTIGIYRTTLDGRIMMANPAMVSMLGFDTFEQLAQRNLQEEGFEPDYPRSKFLESIERDGRIIGLESAWNRRNGKALTVRENANAVRDAKGRILYFDGTVEDITERKLVESQKEAALEALRDSEEQLRIILDSTPFPIAIVDTQDNEIHFWSRSALSLFGHIAPTSSEWYELAYPEPGYRQEVIGRWKPFLEEAKKSGKTVNTGEYNISCKDGSVLKCELYATFLEDKLIVTFNNITERKKAEEALHLKNLVFDASIAANSISDIDGKITEANDAFLKIWGYTEKKEVTGIPISDFLLNNDEAIQIVNAINSNGEWEGDYTGKRKDRSTFVAHGLATVVKDETGKVIGYQSSVLDITGRKQAEELIKYNEKRFRELIESLPQLFWTTRVDGPCDYLSRQWVEYTGIPETDQLGYRWLEQLHPEDKDRTVSEWMEKVKTKESFDIEFRIRRNDGIYHWFKTRAVPMFDSDGNIIKWFGSNTDFDEIKNAADQLINFNKVLEQKVIQRTELLEAANKELEAFSYSVSHDLRAPLRSVHGYTKILIEEYEDKLDEEGKRICGIISSSATQMGELIDDLLNFSRIGSSSMNPSLLDMKSIVNLVFVNISSAKEKSRTKLKIGKLHKAFGDANLIKLVWNNLISNALKYSSKENISEISVSSQLKYDRITYSVKDNGVGFDMNYKHKLFGVFQRLHSESEFEGNGVGLAIVQRIILKHGGKVWAEGEVGKGATFYFSLPVQDKRHK